MMAGLQYIEVSLPKNLNGSDAGWKWYIIDIYRRALQEKYQFHTELILSSISPQ